MILVNRFIKKLNSIGFRSIGFGIHGTHYQESIEMKHFIFSNTYLNYFQQICDFPENKLPTQTYTDYNQKLHQTMIQQFEKVFNNLKITKIELISSVSSSDVVTINSLEDLIRYDKPMVTYRGSDYQGKKIIYTNNYFTSAQSTIPDKAYNFENTTEKETTQNYMMSFHLPQKAQNVVFSLQPYDISKKIIIEIHQSKVLLLSFGIDEAESKYYFQQISKIFKINLSRHEIKITLEQLPIESYCYQNYQRYQKEPHYGVDLSFRLIENTQVIVMDEQKLVPNNHVPFDPTYTVNILLSVLTIKLTQDFGYTKYYLRGSHNNWSCCEMESINDYLKYAVVDTRGKKKSVEIKIDTGIWIESYPPNSNYSLPLNNIWNVYFNLITKDIYHLQANETKSWYIRGTFNDWSTDHRMESVGEEYYHIINNTSLNTIMFKIDNGLWSQSYPDENLTIGKGKYMITFNLMTKNIKITPVDNTQHLFLPDTHYLFQKPQLYGHHDIPNRDFYDFKILHYI